MSTITEAIAAMERAKELRVWDHINHALHVELDVIFKYLAATQAPSAPVAPDERVAFEAWCVRKSYGTNKWSGDGSSYTSSHTIAAWEAWQARAALSVQAEPAAIPEGWQLVPKEPTFEWKSALVKSGYKHSTLISDVLAAAPTPPTTGES